MAAASLANHNHNHIERKNRHRQLVFPSSCSYLELRPSDLSIDGVSRYPKRASRACLRFPAGHSVEQIYFLAGGKRPFPANVRSSLLRQRNALSLTFLDQLPFKLRKSPHDA